MESLLFDFGGTLDADGTTWVERFYPLYKEEGIDVPQDRFNRAFYASDDALPSRFPLRDLSLERTLELQVRCVLESLAPDRKNAGQIIVGRFLSDSRGHFRRNKPVLERLQKKYRLGIVSNFYGNLESVLASEGLRGFFDTVADSGVVGVLKPSPDIFRHALRALGSSPEESVMVGDSIPRDMRGAESLGMKHAWISAGKGSPCCPDSWSLASLSELEPLLS